VSTPHPPLPPMVAARAPRAVRKRDTYDRAALTQAGRHNYSIFRRRTELFGYMEVDDFAVFRAMMDASPIDARWQAEMTSLIDPMTDPATGFHERLDQIFHLPPPRRPAT
jgi:L-rhamnose mutarotase